VRIRRSVNTATTALRGAGLVLLFLTSGVVSAETLPAKGAVDNRIRTAPYISDEVYRLYGFVGYAIELIFEEGETFAGDGGGDLEAITVGWHDNHLILKPKAASVGTNLVIYTNRRAYRFEYSVSPRRPNLETDDVMYAVRFVYPPPPDTSRGPTPEQQADSNLARAGENRRRNYDFWFCGAQAIKPVAASDDGVHTRLTFGAKAELPAIFVRNDDDSESLLNFSMAEGDVVIHRVAPRFILRRGALTGCIVNKGFVGGGERLKSGTVAPDVERLRKGSRQ
jgi:type IV secretion system protein VirB9